MFIVPYKKNDWYVDRAKEMENLQREMNRLFDTTWPRFPWVESTLLGGQWAPPVDVYDSKDNILVKADLPGFSKEEIDVSVQGDILAIKGEKKKDEQVKDEAYYKTERFWGTFYRTLQLPSEVDAEKVKADYKDGVLTLILPKKEEAKPKRIAINVK